MQVLHQYTKFKIQNGCMPQMQAKTDERVTLTKIFLKLLSDLNVKAHNKKNPVDRTYRKRQKTKTTLAIVAEAESILPCITTYLGPVRHTAIDAHFKLFPDIELHGNRKAGGMSQCYSTRQTN